MPLQLRRGVEADRTTIVPANGELIYTTDSKLVYVGDGSTVGGVAVTGGSGISFSTIAVAGQSNVVADSATDTLTLAAGSGISITTNAGTDTITVSSTGLLNIVEDTTPQLGGDLDVNGHNIVSNNDIFLIANDGSGDITVESTNFYVGSTASGHDGFLTVVTNTYKSSMASFVQYHNTADAVNVAFTRARGNGTSPQAVQNNDDLIDLSFIGYDGSALLAGAGMSVTVDGTVSTGKIPTKFTFVVHDGITNGTAGLRTRAVLNAAGVWQINQIGALTGTNISMPTNNSLTVGSVRLNQAGLSTISSNENLVLDAAGTGKVISTSDFEVSGTIGYATGTGGTITQSTNKTTGVTLNKACGTITTASGSINSGDEFSFTVTNSFVDDTDVVLVNIKSGGTAGAYLAQCDQVSNGSFRITVTNISNSTLDEILALNFIIVKSVSA